MKISILNIIIGLFLILTVFIVISGLAWEESSKEYKTNIVTDCNDKDGDIMEGVICYEVLKCSDIMKFHNEKGCEDYIK